MNRRSFLKFMGAAPVAAKPVVEQIGNKLAIDGLPVGKAGGYGQLGLVSSDLPQEACTTSGDNSHLSRLRKAVSWLKKKGVPDHVREDVLGSFDRNPAIPIHIATRRATSPAMKLHYAREEHLSAQIKQFIEQEDRNAKRDKLPDFLRDLWI